MSLFLMHFSGDVRKPQVKEIGGKKAVEFQLMTKNYAAAGSEPTFSWIRVTVFDAKDWQIDQCQEGKFVSGYGEFSLRSFVDKDGAKRQSAEVRSSSFQIDAPRTDGKAGPIEHHAAKPYDSQQNRSEPRRPSPSASTEEIPF